MARQHSEHHVTGWVGWIGFASFMLMLAGVFHMLAGTVALLKEEVYFQGPNALWVLDYSSWGWIHLIGGGLAILAGLSLLQGGMFGRIFAVTVALISAVVNMAFIPIYPVWSVMILAIDVLVIYAIIVHGSELREDHDHYEER